MPSGVNPVHVREDVNMTQGLTCKTNPCEHNAKRQLIDEGGF
ncbi:hypothetical protein [Adlercreutzia sp. ZJ138]|nr:hypothetical protein [Adlercreutzia sp. ZJ138]